MAKPQERGGARSEGGSLPARVHLDGSPIGIEDLEPAIRGPVAVDLADHVRARMQASADAVAAIVAGGEAAYGINTGFGSLCQTRIPNDQLKRLQHNLIVSHAVGVGPPAPPGIVRLMMLLKLVALSRGASGVSRKTYQMLADLLAADVLPVVPTQGSLGASGDLAPLAHMVLPMLGLGEVVHGQGTTAASDALAKHNLTPIELGPKEGLALINGTQFMTAYAVAIAARATRLMKHADLIASMSVEGMAGSVRPFDERLHALRPHAGAVETAGNMRRLLADSEIGESHVHCDRVQDPYSLRCIPQVHGASRDALRHAVGVVETEINSVTDNPVIVDGGDVLSGGLFHGQPIALILDYVALALSELGSISERRTYLLLDGRAGLPSQLIENTGLNSGLMIVQYTAAALASENKGLTMPASADSIPSSMGQEDHVSMGARSAAKCAQILANTEKILAIEQLCAAQALDFRAPLRPGIGARIGHDTIRKDISHVDADRLYGEDIQTSLRMLQSDEILEAVDGELHLA